MKNIKLSEVVMVLTIIITIAVVIFVFIFMLKNPTITEIQIFIKFWKVFFFEILLIFWAFLIQIRKK